MKFTVEFHIEWSVWGLAAVVNFARMDRGAFFTFGPFTLILGGR